ncbi:tumor necrosis factor receptor superfamily member 21-like isoform X2 [Argopecten irradians]|uniref:tumor necrosis factor receptor superfamily member 21-like isoform X2 n=1 Tax=Argopecten irradians TaxID=31199 RepID=UPI0037206566
MRTLPMICQCPFPKFVVLMLMLPSIGYCGRAIYCNKGRQMYQDGMCVDCPECVPGQQLNRTKELNTNVFGALECYPCMECPVGTYSDDHKKDFINGYKCYIHKDCSRRGRVVDIPGTNRTNNVCGKCIEGYVSEDWPSLDKNSYCYPCSLKDRDKSECRGSIPTAALTKARTTLSRPSTPAAKAVKGNQVSSIETDGVPNTSTSPFSSVSTGASTGTTTTDTSNDEGAADERNRLTDDEIDTASTIRLLTDDCYVHGVGNKASILPDQKNVKNWAHSMGLDQPTIDELIENQDGHPIAFLNKYIQKKGKRATLLVLYNALVKHKEEPELKVLVQIFRDNVRKD